MNFQDKARLVVVEKERSVLRKKKLQSGPQNLLTYNEIYPWQQDNEFIISGYQPATSSLEICLMNLYFLHNETVNIYSHLFGLIAFLTLPTALSINIITLRPTITQGDVIVFAIFFCGATSCFFFSAVFHTTSCHSREVNKRGNQLDYLGIVFLIWGSNIPSIFYGFYWNPELQQTYWAIITLIASVCIYATLHPEFNQPALRPWRAAIYLASGLSAVVFIAHSIIIYGWETQKQRMSLNHMVAMAGLNIIGALAYLFRVPERWHPGRFDLWGNSHQILHFMVVFAAFTHLAGLLKAFEYVHGESISA